MGYLRRMPSLPDRTTARGRALVRWAAVILAVAAWVAFVATGPHSDAHSARPGNPGPDFYEQPSLEREDPPGGS